MTDAPNDPSISSQGDDDDDDTGSNNPTASSYTPQSFAGLVYNGLRTRGVDPDVALGAIGSMMGESGRNLNTSALARGDGSDGSDSIGAGQWNGARADNLKATAASMNLPWTDPRVQAQHVLNELDGKYGKTGNYSGVLEGLKNGDSVEDGNNIWTKQYEVPANADAAAASRLKWGQSLANANDAGTLDLNKTGQMGPANGPSGQAGAQAPGALSMGNLGGSPSLGALYQLAMQSQKQAQPDIWSRLGNAGAALASISNPGQAQVLSGMANQNKQATPDNIGAMMKALQIQQLMKSVNQPQQPTMLGDSQGKGQNVWNPTTQQMEFKPYAAGGVDTTDPDAEKAQLKLAGMGPQIEGVTQGLNSNAALMDTALDLKNRLLTNPSIAQGINAAQSAGTTWGNMANESTDAGQWAKDMQAMLKTAALQKLSTTKNARGSNLMLQTDLESYAPNHALNDAVQSSSVLDRILSGGQSQYDGVLAQANSTNAGFKGNVKVPWVLQNADGSTTSDTDAWDKANRAKWAAATEANAKAYPAMKKVHDQNAGIAPPPKSFLSTALGNLGLQ